MTTESYPVPGADGLRYWVYEIDAFGNEIPETISGSPEFVTPKLVNIASDKDSSVTDVVLAIHGWQTDQNGNEAMWIFDTIFSCLFAPDKAGADFENYKRERPGANFLLIGVHWPSAIGSGLVDERRLDEESLEESAERMQRIAAALSASDPDTSEHINNLISEGLDADDDDDDDGDDEEADKIAEAHEEVLRRKLRRSASAGRTGLGTGGVETDEFSNFQKMTRRVLRRVLRRTEHLVFGQYEDRAVECGQNGIHTLFAMLQEAAPHDARFHVVSHSLGAPAHCSALLGQRDGDCILRKKFHTSIFVQSAMDADSFQRGGRYRAMAEGLAPVAGTSLVTTSQHDAALKAYRYFHPVPLGLKGAINAEPLTTTIVELGDTGTSYGLEHGRLYNVVADEYIDDHNNAFVAEVGHLMWTAMNAEVPEDKYALETEISRDYFNLRSSENVEQVLPEQAEHEPSKGGCRIV